MTAGAHCRKGSVLGQFVNFDPDHRSSHEVILDVTFEGVMTMAFVAVSRAASSPIHETMPRTERQEVAEWFAGGAVLAFLVPLVGADLLELHHDLYLLVYFTVVGTFLASFAAHRQIDWRGWLRTRMWWSVGIGAVVAFAIVRKVLSDASMDHPSGAFFWFEVAWRGVLYGTMDALLLFVFPATVAYLLLRDGQRRRRLRYATLTLLLSLGITATYHLGYPQFRDADLAQPEIGALVANVPTVLTGNPIGSLVVHGSYHVAANVHTYRSEIYLPPDLDGYAERGGGAAGLVIAAVWVVLAGSVIYLERRRLFPAPQE
jgi:hypothetical protein